MNYIVLNGYKSTLIKGLLISELPPITKPAVRTSIEEIDGRDGDIVTKLGYAAYDKKMEIGCYGDFNIDDIIQYFSSEGTAVFSNEPDKFYRYQILQAIDFDRLLRFRKATVVFHVQPFKFSCVDNVATFGGFDFALKAYSTQLSGITISTNGNQINIAGTNSQAVSFSIPMKTVNLEANHKYRLRFNVSGGNSGATARVVKAGESLTDQDSMGYQAFSLSNNTAKIFTQSSNKSYDTVYIELAAGTYDMAVTPDYEEHLSEGIVTNRGNIYARPKITLYGSGNVWLSATPVMYIETSISDYITLDGETLNAYKGNVLKNRDVSGDLKDMILNIGRTTISIGGTGKVTKMVVENFSRWI